MSRKYPQIVHSKVSPSLGTYRGKVLGEVKAGAGFWWAYVPGSMVTPGYGRSKAAATKDFLGECECLYGYSPLLFRLSGAGGTAT